MRRFIVYVTLFTLVLLLVIPAIVVQLLPKGSGQTIEELEEPQERYVEEQATAKEVTIHVYRMQTKQIEQVGLEEYIRGVVASEMPVEFELEALKAQAMAARTYMIRRLVEREFSDTPPGSVVTDTEKHQVYQSVAELQERWGLDYEWKMGKIAQAVEETKGKVLTHQGRPINATYFSTSNGYTENSEEYWQTEIPYLRSVSSPWDQSSPRYEERVTMDWNEFSHKLQLTGDSAVSSPSTYIHILSRTEGNRVKEVRIGDRVFTGKEIRELLQLSSSHFDIAMEAGKVHIQTRGWGHGVGMSQWGANGMAQEGYAAEEIVQYYYQGIEIQDYRQWIVAP